MRPPNAAAPSRPKSFAEEPEIHTSTSRRSRRRRTKVSHPSTRWTSSRYRVTPPHSRRRGARRACSSRSQARSAAVIPVRRSSSSSRSNCDSRGAPSASRSALRRSRKDVLPPPRTPVTTVSWPGAPEMHPSRGLSSRVGAVSASDRAKRSRSVEILLSTRKECHNSFLIRRKDSPRGASWSFFPCLDKFSSHFP